MRTRMLALACYLFCLPLFFACDSDDQHVNTSEGDIEVTITPNNTRPVYRWSDGAVKAVRVSVFNEDETSLDLVWAIAADDGQDLIEQPFTHGTVPENCELLMNLEPELNLYGRYEVYVVRENGDSGRRAFTPNDGQ